MIDAMERVSAADPGLSPESLEWLGRLDQDLEVMVFATPT